MWNYNINEAPRGETVERVLTDKNGKSRAVSRHERAVIIAASKCGKVTMSYWIPAEQRWCMFSDKETPLAWQPWPRHPNEAA